MSNLISEAAKSIYRKIELFSEYDPTKYQDDLQYDWVSDDTLTSYHTDCAERLQDGYDEIVGDLASIDENDLNSIPLAGTDPDEFVMQPEDLTDYLSQGLTYEKVVTDDLFGKSYFTSITMESIGAGVQVRFTMDASVTNNGIHAFPFETIDLHIELLMDQWTSNIYFAPTNAGTTISITNMYRGPADNIGDRGRNYYAPIDIASVSITDYPSNYYFAKRSGITWDLDIYDLEITVTFDNGATAVLDLNLPFSVEYASNALDVVLPVDPNGSYIDFQGSITQPAYQWSDFTQTQSPNILAALAALESSSVSPQTTFFINALIDSVESVWDDTIDALEYGEYYDMSDILMNLKADLFANKAIAEAKDVSIIKRYAKTYLANRVFEVGGTYALLKLGINTPCSITMTSAELSDLNAELIDAGVTDFEESSGYYNWANIPECNSKDECSRFSIAIYSQVNDLDDMLLHPAISWISNNYDYIEAEILTTKTELDKVI